MKYWIKRNLHSLTATLTGLVVMLLVWGKLLPNINKIYFGNYGDGLKAYYSALFHTKYDTSFWRMEGMNYPFGEHAIFTDSQPLISNFILLLKPLIDLSNYTTAILNISLLFSFVLGVLFLYKIFEQLKLNVLLSHVGAVGIALLSPQIDRWGGHYSLGLIFLIPLAIYLIIRHHQSPSKKNALLIGVFMFLALFVHPYYIPMATILIGSASLIRVIARKWSVEILMKEFMAMTLMIAIPYGLFLMFMWTTDPVLDRTAFPWGFQIFQANSSGVFYPFQKPYEYIFRAIADPMKVTTEGISYIGLMSLFAIIIGFVIIIVRLVKREFFLLFKNQIIVVLLLGGGIALFLSFGYPFKWDKSDTLLDKFSFFKQFRAMGRFAWVFFYAINIYAIYLISKIIERKKWGWLYVSPLLFFLILDGVSNLGEQPNSLNNNADWFADFDRKSDKNNWLNDINIKAYQAILPLPYFHIGSEGIGSEGNKEITRYFFAASLSSGLPLTSVMLSRTSLKQTGMSMQFHTTSYKYPTLLDKLPSDKPFLIIAKEGYLTFFEKKLLKQSKVLAKSSGLTIAELPVSFFKENVINERLGALFNYSLPNKETYPFYLNSFSDSSHMYSIQNGLRLTKDTCVIDTVNLKNFNKDKDHYISLWLKGINEDLVLRGKIDLRYFDANGNDYYNYVIHCQKEIKVIDGNWGLMEHKIRFDKKTDFIVVKYYNHKVGAEIEMYADELLIREGNHYRETKDWVIENNKFYRKAL